MARNKNMPAVAFIDMQGNATDDMILTQNEKRAGTVTYVPKEDVLRISARVREGARECRRYAGRGMWVSAQWEERNCGLHLVNLDAMREFVRSTIDGHYTRTLTVKSGEKVVVIGSVYGALIPSAKRSWKHGTKPRAYQP